MHTRSFQSTRPHGARLAVSNFSFRLVEFQSTRPHGARRADKICLGTSRGFNPRAHTGRDTATRVLPVPASMFQSTRPHGARHKVVELGSIQAAFQSTRPHGARRCKGLSFAQTKKVSIHAPTRGATPVTLWTYGRKWFQSTRPHGARQYIQQTPKYLYSKLHFLRDMANIHAKLFLLSPTITNYLKLKHCESIAI